VARAALTAPALWPPGAEKARLRSRLVVAVRVALTASLLAWLTAYQPSAPVVLMMVVSVSSMTGLWPRRTRGFPTGLTVPERLIAVPR
jgi:hypothetical protein